MMRDLFLKMFNELMCKGSTPDGVEYTIVYVMLQTFNP